MSKALSFSLSFNFLPSLRPLPLLLLLLPIRHFPKNPPPPPPSFSEEPHILMIFFRLIKVAITITITIQPTRLCVSSHLVPFLSTRTISHTRFYSLSIPNTRDYKSTRTSSKQKALVILNRVSDTLRVRTITSPSPHCPNQK